MKTFLVSCLLLALISGPFLGAAREITYHGGPVLTGAVNTYFIFYGQWETTNEDLLMSFIEELDSTPYFNVLKKYDDNRNLNVTGPLYLKAGVNDNLSHGKEIGSIEKLPDIISGAIGSGNLGDGVDHHGIYFVLTSPEVTIDGFCTKWCSFNSWTDEYPYAFIGHPAQCPDQCLMPLNKETSPNNNVHADSIINAITHELQEVLTDPIGNGWRVADNQEEEIGDFCAPPLATYEEWLGEVKTADNGSKYNVEFGGKKYLIQTVWDPVLKKCVLGSD